ncbi:MAG: hypothetical protein K2L24_02105 [Opitutales bacterium]|nr:hypothetical protein [Opitutales bacterium]
MAPIRLCDTLRYDFSSTPRRKEMTITSSRTLPFDDKNNTITQAIQYFQKATGIEKLALENITLQKKIPTGAGFGGGSSNGATTLMALNDF